MSDTANNPSKEGHKEEKEAAQKSSFLKRAGEFVREHIFRILVAAFLFFGLYWYGLPWLEESFWPARTAHIRAAEEARDKLIRKEANEKGLAGRNLVSTAKSYKGDLATTAEAGNKHADKLAATANVGEAWVDRAAGRIPVIPQKVVSGNQHSWISVAPVHEPMLVTVPPTDLIRPHKQIERWASADGIPLDDVPNHYRFDQTVVVQDYLQRAGLNNDRWTWVNHTCTDGVCTDTLENFTGTKIVQVPNSGNFYEMVGQICNDQGQGCSPATPMGTQSVVCPGGYLRTWANGRPVIDGLHDVSSFSQGSGVWRLQIQPHPAAHSICAANPGKKIIKLVEISTGG